MAESKFVIGQLVEITDLEYLRRNDLPEGTKGTILGSSGFNAFYKKNTASVALADGTGRIFLVWEGIFTPLSEPTKSESDSKASRLPVDAADRKKTPLWSGLVQYFPDALVAVAQLSQKGNDQHNGVGSKLHWAKEKSSDHEDTLLRHLFDSGTVDTDGIRHSAKVAWRGLALLQTEIEKEKEKDKAAKQPS